jgi:hypothetical protein
MTEQQYFERELHLAMLAMAGQHIDKVRVLYANPLYTTYQFRYTVKLHGKQVPTFQYLKCFKN